jgi:bifunctional non-homologous end joining protein LigD
VPTYPGIDLSPMDLTTGPPPFGRPGWTYEIKWDGWRAIATVNKVGLQLVSRTGRDLTERFPEFRTFPSLVRGELVLDGEIIAGMGTMADFPNVMSRDALRFFVAFDVLAIDGRVIIDEPLERRRAHLSERISNHLRLIYSRSYDDGAALFERVTGLGYEGVVAKRLGSIYRPGERSRDWLKVKSAEAAATIRERFDR